MSRTALLVAIAAIPGSCRPCIHAPYERFARVEGVDFRIHSDFDRSDEMPLIQAATEEGIATFRRLVPIDREPTRFDVYLLDPRQYVRVAEWYLGDRALTTGGFVIPGSDSVVLEVSPFPQEPSLKRIATSYLASTIVHEFAHVWLGLNSGVLNEALAEFLANETMGHIPTDGLDILYGERLGVYGRNPQGAHLRNLRELLMNVAWRADDYYFGPRMMDWLRTRLGEEFPIRLRSLLMFLKCPRLRTSESILFEDLCLRVFGLSLQEAQEEFETFLRRTPSLPLEGAWARKPDGTLLGVHQARHTFVWAPSPARESIIRFRLLGKPRQSSVITYASTDPETANVLLLFGDNTPLSSMWIYPTSGRVARKMALSAKPVQMETGEPHELVIREAKGEIHALIDGKLCGTIPSTQIVRACLVLDAEAVGLEVTP